MNIEKVFLRNEIKIYAIFAEIMILFIILAYRQRGYLAFGGEVLVMLIPLAYSFYVRSKKIGDDEK